MDYIYTPDYQALGQTAAGWLAREILCCPNIVMGMATGGTPVSTYQYLAKLAQEKLITFAQVRTFNLDEYVGLAPDHPQSYYYYMRQNLWSRVDIPLNSVDIPRGNAPDLAAECRRYDQAIKGAGGIDVQVLGIGLNGHIGFNEPSDSLTLTTHVVDLTEDTIQANARFFDNIADVPRKAITMGIAGIMKARKILLLVNGENKKEILERTLYGPVTPEVPASVLQLHANLTVVTDIKL